MALAGLIAVPLALLSLAIYLAVARPADVVPYTIALQIAVCLLLLGNLASGMLRKQRRSPEKLMHLITRASALLCTATALVAGIGQQHHWMHGAYQYAVTAIAGLFVLGIPVYWFGGQRRLLAALKARDASRHRPT